MPKLSVSIIASDFRNLEKIIEDIETSGADYIHADIMDGVFVPNITFGPSILRTVSSISKLKIDTHLMIIEPLRYIQKFIDAGSNRIAIHLEAAQDEEVKKTLKEIKENGLESGIAINPKTPVHKIKYFENLIDFIIIMGVNPGFSYQKLIPYTKNKINEAISAYNKEITIDGGVNLENILDLLNRGAKTIVSGGFFFKGEKNKVKEFISLIHKYR